jgi:hypothetical protein
MGQTGQSEAIHSPEACASIGGQIDDADGAVDRFCLHGCDLVATKRLSAMSRPVASGRAC